MPRRERFFGRVAPVNLAVFDFLLGSEKNGGFRGILGDRRKHAANRLRRGRSPLVANPPSQWMRCWSSMARVRSGSSSMAMI